MTFWNGFQKVSRIGTQQNSRKKTIRPVRDATLHNTVQEDGVLAVP